MNFAQIKSIAWKTCAELLGITEPTAALTGATSSTFLRGDGTWAAAGGSAATQAEQETGTATNVYVSPGRQQYHQSAPKFWAYVTVSGGTPSLSTSFNVTSITDTAVGQLTITLTTPFSSANWTPIPSVGSGAVADVRFHPSTSRAAGTILLLSSDTAGVGQDPVQWGCCGFGDQ